MCELVFDWLDGVCLWCCPVAVLKQTRCALTFALVCLFNAKVLQQQPRPHAEAAKNVITDINHIHSAASNQIPILASVGFTWWWWCCW